jgi:hypothetical protein
VIASGVDVNKISSEKSMTGRNFDAPGLTASDEFVTVANNKRRHYLGKKPP